MRFRLPQRQRFMRANSITRGAVRPQAASRQGGRADERPSSACGTFSPRAGRRKRQTTASQEENRCRSLSPLPARGERGGASENLVSQGCNCCATLATTSAKRSAPHPPAAPSPRARGEGKDESRLPVTCGSRAGQRLNRRVRRWKKPGFLCVAAGAGVAAGVVGREPLSASRARALPFERGVALPEAAPLSCGFIPADLVS